MKRLTFAFMAGVLCTLGYLVTGYLLTTVPANAGTSNSPVDLYRLGLADGAAEAFYDGVSVRGYHRCIGDLPETAARADFCGCWKTEVTQARASLTRWYADPAEDRVMRPPDPFWRRNIGVPRSLIWNDGNERCVIP